MRTSSESYFLDIALRSAQQGTCCRRNYGAVIVDKNNKTVSTGYTGNPAGTKHCSEIGTCWRQEHNIPSGTAYEMCKSVHAEQNALIQAGNRSLGSIMFISGYDVATGKEIAGMPCFLCAKMLVNAGIEFFVYKEDNIIKRQYVVNYYEKMEKQIFG